jgi:hypothetical protein
MHTVCISLILLFFLGCSNYYVTKEHAQNTISDGLIAYYPLDGDVKDQSGNGHDGATHNSCLFVPGVQNQALRVVGVNSMFSTSGGYVSIPGVDTTGLRSLSLCLWVREDFLYLPDAGEAYIILGTAVDTAWCGIAHFYGEIQFAVGANQGDYVKQLIKPISVPFDPADGGSWVFYALVYDNGYFTAYKNSVQMAGVRQQLRINGNSAFIASHSWCGTSPGSSTRFTGAIDEVRIYNRVLSQLELDQLNQAGRSHH